MIALEAWKRVLGCQFDRVAHHAIALPHVLDGEPQKVEIAFDLARVRYWLLADIMGYPAACPLSGVKRTFQAQWIYVCL